MQISFRIFNRKGEDLNPQLFENITYEISDPEGSGCKLRIWSNWLGSITHIWIIDGGIGYISPNITFKSSIDSRIFFIVDNSNITLSPQGEIIAINLNQPDNIDLDSNSFFYFSNNFLDRTSVGLIQSETYYLLEEVWNEDTNKKEFSKLSYELLGPFVSDSYFTNNGITTLNIPFNQFNAFGDKNNTKINVIGAFPTVQIGQKIKGPGIDTETYIIGFNTITREINLNKPLLNDTNGLFTSWSPHGLRTANRIKITSGPLMGEWDVVDTYDTSIIISTPDLENTGTIVLNNDYYVFPKILVRILGENWNLFNVIWGEEYPEISPIKSYVLEPDYHLPGEYSYTPNGVQRLRIVNNSSKKEELIPINIMVSSQKEDILVGTFEMIDTTFVWNEEIMFKSILETETVDEDHRLGILLQNKGYNITIDEAKLFRDANISESLTDWILLNRKRKELLLEGDKIFPYIGTYKSLFKILDYFGYSDIGIKEYFLNVNQNSEDYNKIKQITIKGSDKTAKKIDFLRNKSWKKTNALGLTFPIIKVTNEEDQYGIPETIDAFEFTIEEVLIKLFGLKKYLKEKFLPLNSRIIDITGEGVYFKRLSINNWNNWNTGIDVNLGRVIDFECPNEIFIDWINNPKTPLKSPNPLRKLKDFTVRWKITGFTVTNPGGPYYQIPQIILSGGGGNDINFRPFMRAKASNSIVLSSPVGSGFQSQDRLTLGGGSYLLPIIITIANVGVNGEILEIQILEGQNQGSEYRSLPSSGYNIILAQRVNGGIWETFSPNQNTIFSLNDIPLEIEGIIWQSQQNQWITPPQVIINPNNGSTIDVNLEKIDNLDVGQLSNFLDYKIIDDEQEVIGAILNLKTNFNLNWNDLGDQNWETGDNNAHGELKPWFTPVPYSPGELLAIEIVSEGSGYKFSPSGIVDGDGNGASFNIEIENGKIKKINREVISVASGVGINDIITVNNISNIGPNQITAGKIVTGNGIPEGTVISSINYITGEIFLESYTGNPVITSLSIGDQITIHQGVTVITPGTGYSEIQLSIFGGQSVTNYTWETIGRWEFYQMQWIVKLTGEKNDKQFFYDSGIKPIDELISHQIILPYIGLYTIELRIYDLSNNISNRIKKDYLRVSLYDLNLVSVSKWTGSHLFDWNSNLTWEHSDGDWLNGIEPNVNMIEDMILPWNSFLGNQEIRWEDKKDWNIIDVSQNEYFEGDVVNWLPALNQIIVNGQNLEQPLNPIYDQTDWIYIVRDQINFHLKIQSVDYSTPGVTKITLFDDPPTIFKNTFTKWKVYRYLSNNIVVQNNPNFSLDNQWIKLVNTNPQYDFRIKNWDTTNKSILIETPPLNVNLIKKGEIGYIYRKRDWNISNGELVWNSNPVNSKWILKEDQDEPDNKGRIIINTIISIDLLNEIRPGFQEIRIKAAKNDLLNYSITLLVNSAQLFTGDNEYTALWGQSVWILDITSLSGPPLNLINNLLNDISIDHLIWLEYEYDVFLTKNRWSETGLLGEQIIYPEFNIYPANENFKQFVFNPPVQEPINANWFWRSNFLNQEVDLKILSKGPWKNTQNIILRVDDPNSYLIGIDTNFKIENYEFSKEESLKIIGKIQEPEWENSKDLNWEVSKWKNWETNCFNDPITNYEINFVNISSGSINLEFNYYTKSFNLSPGNLAYKWGKLLEELYNSLDWLDWFDYIPVIEQNKDQKILIDTKSSINQVTIYTTDTISPNSVLWLPLTLQSFRIINVTPVLGGYILDLDKDIKRNRFHGDINDRIIKNIKWLYLDEIEEGISLSSDYLNPIFDNKIQQIITQGNNREKILQLIISDNSVTNGETEFLINHYGETTNFIIIPSNVTNSDIKITVRSKDNSIQSFGLWTTVGIQLESNKIVSNQALNYNLGEFNKWIEAGREQIGGFLNGGYDIVSEFPDVSNWLGIDPDLSKPFQRIQYDIPEYFNIADDDVFLNAPEGYYEMLTAPYIITNRLLSVSKLKWQKDNAVSPVGVKHLISAEGSRTVGKQDYKWEILFEGKIISILYSKRLWITFNKIGTWEIICTCFDNFGNSITKSMNIIVEESPEINISKNRILNLNNNDNNVGPPYSESFSLSFDS